MVKKISIGVAGAGVFGSFHTAKISAHKDAVFAGVYDPDSARASALSREHDGEAYGSFADMVANVDAVVIAAPASQHFELAQAALTEGRHTFVEKPLALTPVDADKLIALASANNCVLQVGHQERYVFNEMGFLSWQETPQKIECVRSTDAAGRCEDVSVVFDLMIHDLDIVRQLTKADLVDVAATGDKDNVTAELTLSDGAKAKMSAARKASSVDRRLTAIYGSGVVEIDFVKRACKNSTPMPLKAEINQFADNLAMSDPLAFGTDQFISAIKSGADPVISGEDGRVAVDWAHQIEAALPISLDTSRNAEERLIA